MIDLKSAWLGGLFVFMVFLAFVDKKTKQGLSLPLMVVMALLWPVSLVYIVIGTFKEPE